ncbi:putative WD repeat-containing protein 16 [Monocercomonoides exilis]|uniref:putative WD repeat-containing protein 16 n=1 Tax=Monocercomonoides exilis TaxID=2049356 RepID=UPI003559B40F|nr:putative WD repeat-containing protein 16 [Monocercomonoides exilis]|eukprot:MONOS_8634.1-p1 / transcript=MONOS_8634.1 / gene=MONOS_8634 / organism=Monocercomonoides_exilis_PA203 / gene_product=WD repeat-containing protein 16 / transcript_product=WD repeat-containing protein 16 / location=Mono_scaffold00330:38258-40679(-) / protein_length=691 / sequence_SO=supercontig / SO=protein_coding / is_pseudo=false
MSDFEPLPLEQTIGFAGTIPGGYKLHPNGQHVVYAIGCNLVISQLGGSQEFLIGHSGHITCFAISKSGKYIASGEETRTGFPAYIIIWDFETRTQLFKLKQHNGKVQSLSFSPSEQYMVSLGGLDDKNVVVWKVDEGKPICGSPVAIDAAYFVEFFRNSDESFLTGGLCQPRVWDIDYRNTKLIPNDCQLGHFRRVSLCAVIDETDELAYIGTTTGDIMVVHMQTYLLKHYGPSKDINRLQGGCTSLALFRMAAKGLALAAGSGNGDVVVYTIPDPMNATKPLFLNVGKVQVMGKVSSINVRPYHPAPPPAARAAPARTVRRTSPSSGAGRGAPKKISTRGPVIPMATAQRALIPRQTEAVRPPSIRPAAAGPQWELVCGTEKGCIYSIIIPDMKASLKGTCHTGPVTGVAFPLSTSEIFASCSQSGDIRLWHMATGNELLRIEVPNQECLCVCFNPSGSEIISGWSDGKIRAFGPETGRLLYVINDAHKQVTCITTYSTTNQYIVSGGSEGQVRVWKLGRESQTLVATLKEHRTKVNAVRVNFEDTECVSVSDDGTCYTWSLSDRYVRLKQMMKHANFLGVDYLPPDCCQVVVCGSDRMVSYYDSVEGKLLRELELSEQEIMDVAINPTGSLLACAGRDKMVKVVDYDEGKIVLLGQGHPEMVSCLAWSPDGYYIVSGSHDGSVFVWSLN